MMCFAAWMESRNRIARRKRTGARRAGCCETAAMGRLRMRRRRAGCLTRARNRWAWRCWISIKMAGRICWWRTIRSRTSFTKNLRNGKFKDVAVEAGIAFSPDGKARAGMGVAIGDFENAGRAGIAITNFDNEMIGVYRAGKTGGYEEISLASGIGAASKTTLGFGCAFLDADLDGRLDLAVANGHIDETVRNIRGNVGYAQAPQLFLNSGGGKFRDVATEAGSDFAKAKVGRGLAVGDFDRDGDLDLLMTTNNGPAYLYRNDQSG